jgi:hypothetical protein
VNVKQSVALATKWIRKRWTFLDWRLGLISLITVVALVATGLVYLLGSDAILNPSTHEGAMFASWVASVRLFAVVGLTTTVVSLVRPEFEGFDARARILFRKQDGAHIDYVISTIHRVFEHYAEKSKVTVIIDDYDAGENKYWVRGKMKTTIRNYIEDIRSQYPGKIKMSDVTLPPAGKQENKIAYLLVNATPLLGTTKFDKEIFHQFVTTVDRDERCNIDHSVDTWVLGETEDNSYETVRYTQFLSLSFHNHLDREVMISLVENGQERQLRLTPGQKLKALEMTDIKPGQDVYTFTIGRVDP